MRGAEVVERPGARLACNHLQSVVRGESRMHNITSGLQACAQGLSPMLLEWTCSQTLEWGHAFEGHCYNWGYL